MVWHCIQKQAAFSVKMMNALVLLEDFTQRTQRKRGVKFSGLNLQRGA